MAIPQQIISKIINRANPRLVIDRVSQTATMAATAKNIVNAQLVVSVGSFICIPYLRDTHTIISDLAGTVNTPSYAV
jgi:hypothetical protein